MTGTCSEFNVYSMFTVIQLTSIDCLLCSRACVGCCPAAELASPGSGVPQTAASLFSPPRTPPLHLTKCVGGCLGTGFFRERGRVRALTSFSHVSAVGLVSRVNIWTHSIKWSPGKKNKKDKYLQFCSGFFIEPDESMVHEKAVRPAEGG